MWFFFRKKDPNEQEQTLKADAAAKEDELDYIPAASPPPPYGSEQSSSEQQYSRPEGWPWSIHRLILQPPVLGSGLNVKPVTAPSPSPFPRYGHVVSTTVTSDGELLLFGGLVQDAKQNDLYTLSTRDFTASLVQTSGDVPAPRIGHAGAQISRVLIIWGGDVKVDGGDMDDGLYLLNLSAKEWTRARASGPSPMGRYGHVATMVGSKFFIFGGQVGSEFLDDIWAFDLNSLKSEPTWEQYDPVPDSPKPARRTGHVCVTYGDCIVIFGGTDGQYHYNDTWMFDVPTRQWTELPCIGYIPAPREGHTAALVDDVMYIFGGRGVDGKDLGGLAAFKISGKRWFMFQNMGPGPDGCSGHAMASYGSQVFVLGGESSETPPPSEPAVVHVLETKHIKYPQGTKS